LFLRLQPRCLRFARLLRRSRQGKFIAWVICQVVLLVLHSTSTPFAESCAISVISRVKTFFFEPRYAEDKSERAAALADELVGLKVDVIIAGGSNDTRSAKNATKTIPIVFMDAVSDPVVRGLVDSLARPGGNITGLYSMADVLAGKRLEVLKESMPKLSRVAVLWYPTSGSNEPQWTESQLVARHLGLQLHSMNIGSTNHYESAFKEAIKTGSTALALIRHRLSHTTNQKRGSSNWPQNIACRRFTIAKTLSSKAD
jgi:ABC-type uncharacterized transport system substrate-binding protein